MNLHLAIAAFAGFTSVAMGAYLDHATLSTISNHALQSLEKALHYHELYAVILTVLALLVRHFECSRAIFFCMLIFTAGTLCFCGGIYANYLLSWPILKIVPFGGSLLMLGWLVLLFAALFSNTKFFNPKPKCNN